MGKPQSFKVGEAPWEKSSQPQTFKVGDAPWETAAAGEKPADPAAMIRTGARSALETITVGASEPVFGAIHSVDKTFDQGIKALGDKLHGRPTDFSVVEALKKNYAEDVENRRADKEQNPGSNLTGGLAGAVFPAGPAATLMSKTVNLVGRGAKGAAAVVPAAVASSRAAQLGGRIAKGAAEAAAAGVAFEAPRQAVEKATGYIKPGDKDAPDLADVGKVGALVGGGLPLVGAAIRGGGRAAAAGGKKLMSAFLGPAEEHIEYYLKNPEAVNGAKSLAELKDKVDGIVDSLRERVTKGELSHADAKAELRDLEQKVAQHRSESKFEYDVTATEIRQQFRDSKAELEKSFARATQDLKDVKAPTALADDVVESVGELKNKLVEGSKAAQENLSDVEKISTVQPRRALMKFRDSLNVAGQTPDPFTAKTQSQIDELITTIGKLPSKITEREAKELLLRLDRSEQASKAYTAQAQGGFTEDLSRAYKQLREAVNEQLVASNPKYDRAMEPVREAARLYAEAGNLGDKQKALSLLNRIAGNTAGPARETLAKLSKATGRDFETQINQFLDAQSKLKDPKAMEKIRQSLPEFSRAKEAEKAVRMLEGPSAKAQFVENRLKESGLPKKVSAAERRLLEREAEVAEAQGKLEPFKNITPRNSQETLARAGGKLKGEERTQLVRQLDELSKLSDTDFVKAVKDLQTKRAFEGTDINGSRKTNLFALVAGSVAGGIAAAVGHSGMGVELGLGAGATMGAIADKYGPAIAKKILDAAISMKGSPSLQKIKALSIPPEAKAYLSDELARFSESGGSQIQKVSDGPLKGEEKWADDGFKKLQESGADLDKSALLKSKAGKRLLIEASDMKPGSKGMAKLLERAKLLAGGE